MRKQKAKKSKNWASCKTPLINLGARPTFTNDLTQAVRIGRRFRRDSDSNTVLKIMKHGPYMFSSDLERMSYRSAGAKEALTAAIFFACKDSKRSSSLDKAMFGALSQRHLTRAFLWLPPEQRIELMRAHNAMRVNRVGWITGCAGALAVARMCYPLLFLTSEVYLPEPIEDVNQKVDLLALFDNGTGLCIQSKAKLTKNFSTFHPVLLKKRSPNANGDKETVAGFRSFAKKYPRSWIFAAGNVGMMERKIGDLENCTDLQRKLLTFVMRRIPDLAGAYKTAS